MEGKTPLTMKTTVNNHYNGSFLEPWGDRSQRGYGVEVIDQFFREIGYVEHGGPESQRAQRLAQMQSRGYNDLSADRQTVAAVQALELTRRHAAGQPDCVVRVNDSAGGLVLMLWGQTEPDVLYQPRV